MVIGNEAVWNRLSDPAKDLQPRLLGMDLLRYLVFGSLGWCILYFVFATHKIYNPDCLAWTFSGNWDSINLEVLGSVFCICGGKFSIWNSVLSI